MKKLLLGVAALYLATGSAAYANEFNVDVSLGAPAIIAPAPLVIAPSPAYVVAPGVVGYDPHHRRGDWRYWHDRHEREMHHDEHWDHDHRHY